MTFTFHAFVLQFNQSWSIIQRPCYICEPVLTLNLCRLSQRNTIWELTHRDAWILLTGATSALSWAVKGIIRRHFHLILEAAQFHSELSHPALVAAHIISSAYFEKAFAKNTLARNANCGCTWHGPGADMTKTILYQSFCSLLKSQSKDFFCMRSPDKKDFYFSARYEIAFKSKLWVCERHSGRPCFIDLVFKCSLHSETFALYEIWNSPNSKKLCCTILALWIDSSDSIEM